jgi:apolipoprotein N-acyltransferase
MMNAELQWTDLLLAFFFGFGVGLLTMVWIVVGLRCGTNDAGGER